LASEGVSVTVIDAGREVGGKLRVAELAGIAIDEGAEAFVRRRPEALELAASVGLADRVVPVRTSAPAVWARGRLRPMPTGTVMGIPSNLSALRGVLSAAEVARARADSWLPGTRPEQDVAVGAWVRHRLGGAVVDRLVDPLLGGVYAGRADQLSLAATVPQLPRDERSVRRAAARAVAEMPATGEPVFATLTGGLGALPLAVAGAVTDAGGGVLRARAVRRLERAPGGWRVVHGPTIDEQVVDADAVVIAAPASPAARLLSDVAPAASAELAAVETASVAIVTTVWRSEDAPSPGSSGYLVPAEYRRPVKAVTFSSTKWAHLALPGLTVVRCSIGRIGDVCDLQQDDADLVAAAAAELTSYAGFVATPVAARVSRWGGALPQYAVGHRERVARIRAAVAAQPGLVVCGATYDGVGVPACIATGRQAAAEVVRYLRSREGR
jgi:oxygen-dependent protoporphyrinogen oxidase